jgi:hypothetical protein
VRSKVGFTCTICPRVGADRVGVITPMTVKYRSESFTVWVCADFDLLPFEILSAVYHSSTYIMTTVPAEMWN